MKNILALIDINDKFKVTINNKNKKAIIVHFLNKILKFRQLDNRL